MRTASAQWNLVMHFCRRHDQPPPPAHFAQRMCLDVAVAYLTPFRAVTHGRIVGAFIFVVTGVHDVYMIRTIHIVREVRAAWESARLFRFPRHSFPLQKKGFESCSKPCCIYFSTIISYHKMPRITTVQNGSFRFKTVQFLLCFNLSKP